MKVLITGSDGFVAKNLRLHLAERADVDVVLFNSGHSVAELPDLLQDVDFVFHLAGVNRPQYPAEFIAGNSELTQQLCDAICAVADKTGRKIPVLFSSSVQAERDNPYGQSKRAAEDAVFAAARSHEIPAYVFRLPNVFGKWCRPDYNSAVATFCHNIARDLPIQINDPDAPLSLVYIDDVVECFLNLLEAPADTAVVNQYLKVAPEYRTTVGEVAGLLRSFKDTRDSLDIERVGTGLVRALYSTYVSYLPVSEFSYPVQQHGDARGVFVEMLKTPDCGQFSFFTSHPGVTRGGHYHHSKTEKFLVIQGQARFKFRQMQTQESYELSTSGDEAVIVETVPGWTHDITNVGENELIVMLWANEVFDHDKPDTYASPL